MSLCAILALMRRGLLAFILALAQGTLGCNDSSCASGFREEAGVCVAACDEPCGEHELCAETENGGVCVCAPGYDGEPCAWKGVIRDPEFADSEIWSDTTNGAVIIPLAQGESATGIASFESSVVCNAGAVAQVVQMPSYEDAEPLVAEVTFRSQNVNGVAVGYGRAFQELQSAAPFPAWETQRLCLGEAAYGGDVRFQVAASDRLPDCFFAPTGLIEVDRFSVEVAEPGECPAPGTVANGTAEVDGGGWRFIISPDGTGFPEAELIQGAGRDGTDGVRLFQSEGTTRVAFATTRVSVPLATTMPSPALRFWYYARAAGWFDVGLGTVPSGRVARHFLDTLVGGDVPRTATYCLPPHTHGRVSDLFFRPNGALTAELFVDDVEIATDPKCGSATNLLDPGFDSAPNRWPGVSMLIELQDPSSQVLLIDDPAHARPPGAGALEIRYSNSRARIDAESWVWVLPPDEVGNPMLVFHADAPVDPGLGLFWALGGSTAVNFECVGSPSCPATPITDSLLPGGGWRRYEVCLPPEWAERWLRFRLAVRPSEGPREVFDPPRSVFFDDFEVTTDPSCPGL
ncbi:MAG: hypothetical protein WCE62_16250 [Polyangiales bacterium]